jgi:opacity protein-like surface antigen
MKKILSVLAVSAFVLTANAALAGGPGKKQQQGPGCPEACQQQIDDLQSGQAQQNEQLSSHGKQLENHEGRIKKLEENNMMYGPWFARGGLKLVWPSQADYLSNDIEGEMGWGFQGAVGKVFPTDYGAFRLEFEYAQQKSDIEDTDGDVDIQTYMMNGAYELPVADMIALYGTVGAGYGKYDLNAPLVLSPNGNVAWVNHGESVFAYKAGAGVTYNISEEMAVDLGYEYLGTSHAVINGAELNKIGSHNIVTSFRFMF